MIHRFFFPALSFESGRVRSFSTWKPFFGLSMSFIDAAKRNPSIPPLEKRDAWRLIDSYPIMPSWCFLLHSGRSRRGGWILKDLWLHFSHEMLSYVGSNHLIRAPLNQTLFSASLSSSCLPLDRWHFSSHFFWLTVRSAGFMRICLWEVVIQLCLGWILKPNIGIMFHDSVLCFDDCFGPRRMQRLHPDSTAPFVCCYIKCFSVALSAKQTELFLCIFEIYVFLNHWKETWSTAHFYHFYLNPCSLITAYLHWGRKTRGISMSEKQPLAATCSRSSGRLSRVSASGRHSLETPSAQPIQFLLENFQFCYTPFWWRRVCA